MLEHWTRLSLSSLALHPSPVSTTRPRVTRVPVTAVLLVEIFFEIMQKKIDVIQCAQKWCYRKLNCCSSVDVYTVYCILYTEPSHA